MKPVVAIDVDGVLLDHEGKPYPGAVEFTKRVARFADIVIHTCRCTPEVARCVAYLARNELRELLDGHGFVYHEIFIGQSKPVANAYVDDLAVSCRPQIDGEGAFKAATACVMVLCNLEADRIREHL